MKPISGHSNARGFTLVELLVVIAVLAVIVTWATVSFTSSRSKARDTQRVHDIKEIQTALEMYYSRHQYYPTAITAGQALAANGVTYLDVVPANPSPRTDGDCPDSEYKYSGSGSNYVLSFCLGSGSGAVASGTNHCSNGTCAPCGEYKVRDHEGNTYTTVQVGTQCWMGQNLRTKYKPDGTCINGGSPPCRDASSADDSLGRACPQNNEANCPTYGALYLQATAKNGGSSDPMRGICPVGWHLPSVAELETMEQYLADPGQSCKPSRSNGTFDCLTAGTKLKVGGSTGMEVYFAGYRTNAIPAVFGYFPTSGTYIWSSTNLWTRFINAASAGIARTAVGATVSASVRCIKD